jgi:hypothetical protein
MDILASIARDSKHGDAALAATRAIQSLVAATSYPPQLVLPAYPSVPHGYPPYGPGYIGAQPALSSAAMGQLAPPNTAAAPWPPPGAADHFSGMQG